MELSSPDNDIELIEKYKKGDKGSLEKIYFKYKKRLLKLIWYYVHNIDDAEDVLQLLFIKLIKNISKYKPYKDVKFSTWLFRIAINTARDFLKKRKIEASIEYPDLIEDIKEKVEDKIINKQFIEEIQNSVSHMPIKYREVISLIYFEGFKYDEAAEILNKPIGTIKSRINYALNLLRKKFNIDLK